MSIKALQILANVLANTNTPPATTANNPETVMQNTPFPLSWLATTEKNAVLTVDRSGSIVHYVHCTDGAQYVDGHIPNTDGGFWSNEVRNVRDWDYALRLLALNGFLEVGDLVEVKVNAGYMPVFRVVVESLDFPNWWRLDGVRQPVENVLVSIGFRSHRYYGDNGGWADRFRGKTHPITGIVEPDLSRW